ncbi:alpha-galactosidase [Streptomyces sp. NPDC058001]|uniref:alpha-galactosidase n=1 Tax=Streptomyces sp. NPDC058001 TaxID=3346300 RepID=UPI0036E4880E
MTDGVRLESDPQDEATVIRVRSTKTETTLVRLDVPLGDGVGYWHPAAGWERPLPADWEGEWRRVGLVDSAAAGCLYDGAGRALLAFAGDHGDATTLIRFGVSEDSARFGVWLATPLRADEEYQLRIEAPGRPVDDTLRTLARWMPGTDDALPAPEAGRTPAYSTWYSMHHAVSEAAVEAEAAVAADLGCGLLLLDDGWQAGADHRKYSGCGDWTPDPAKFPDFRAHVRRVRETGLRYVAWIAPLLLGEHSRAHAELAGLAPHHVPRLACRVLDPRQDEVRAFVVERCADLVERYGLDGLKLDFLEKAMVYADTAEGGEGDGAADVSRAMRTLLDELHARLRALRGDDVLIELRQPYAGPTMRRFGNLLRAGDCPADATANRLRTLDIARLAPGASVHCDMLMWDPDARVEAAARQLHAALYSVPQISVRLTELSTEHREMTAWWLGFWRQYRDVLIDGERDTGRPDQRDATVTAWSGDRAVVTVFGEHRVVPLEPDRFTDVALVNSTTAGHLVLDLTAHTRVLLSVTDARGRPAGTHVRELGPGPHHLPVPPSGVCRLSPA